MTTQSSIRFFGASTLQKVIAVVTIVMLQLCGVVTARAQEISSAQSTGSDPEFATNQKKQRKAIHVMSAEHWLDNYYRYSGIGAMNYISVGYTYSFVNRQNLLSVSLCDFRVHIFGMSALGIEMALSPWDKRIAYKPQVRVFLPATKFLAVVPYAGFTVDISGIAKLAKKDADYDKARDLYSSFLCGVSAYFTIVRKMPFEVKAEFRTPVVTPTAGTPHPQGFYLSTQIYFGKIYEY